MKSKDFWTYFLIGAIVGLIVGFMKNQIGIWLGVGAGIGFLLALFIESRLKNKVQPEKLMWLGFFLIFPIMFFADYLKVTRLYDAFGILAVMGASILVINFVKVIRKKKGKKTNKTTKKKARKKKRKKK